MSTPKGSITIKWRANTEPDLASYKVYYGTSPGIYTNNANVGLTGNLGNASNPQHQITGLNNGTTYYFAITAIDTSNNESLFSQEVQQTVAVPFTGLRFG